MVLQRWTHPGVRESEAHAGKMRLRGAAEGTEQDRGQDTGSQPHKCHGLHASHRSPSVL